MPDADPFERLIASSDVLDYEGAVPFSELVDRASELLSRQLGVPADTIAQGLLEGAGSGLTPMSQGVVLPHLHLDDISRPRMVLARVREGIEIDAGEPDVAPAKDEPIQAAFFLASPAADPRRHLRTLARIAGRVDDERFLTEWLEAEDDLELREVMLRDEHMLVVEVLPEGASSVLAGMTIHDMSLPEDAGGGPGPRRAPRRAGRPLPYGMKAPPPDVRPALWTGTSGFSYKEWKGSFYPEKLPATKMLEYYSRQLPSVEINNTFYRMPRAEMLEKWAAQVPDDFAFVLKANRRITHMKRLKDAADPLDYQARTAIGALGEKLGPILFQLPPYLRNDVDRLRDFLAILPDGLRAAFEFRHDSWFVEEVYQALADRGAALVTADTGEGEAPVVETASFGYARLRRPGYGERDLADWAEALNRPAWSDVFVFFKHEDEGAGPRMAAAFQDVWRVGA